MWSGDGGCDDAGLRADWNASGTPGPHQPRPGRDAAHAVERGGLVGGPGRIPAGACAEGGGPARGRAVALRSEIRCAGRRSPANRLNLMGGGRASVVRQALTTPGQERSRLLDAPSTGEQSGETHTTQTDALLDAREGAGGLDRE